MGRSHDRISPDRVNGVFDLDRGESDVATRKEGELISQHAYDTRADLRSGARELDDATENLPGLTRAQRDLNRAYPRPTPAAIGNSRLRPQLPPAIELRRTLSARQRNTRSATKRRVLDAMPKAQYTALASLTSDPKTWRETNNALSAVAGDAVELDDARRKQVQRVDRAIQRYERESGRGHLVYTSVSIPNAVVNPSDLPSTLSPGTVLSFDRFTAATHSLHELDSTARPTDVVFEIQTDRGMYYGQSSRVDNSHHLLPRGMQLQVVGAHFVPYERPGHPPGERLVVQLVDHETP
ncbi:hypothetical protein CBI38_36480 (plasmid) [Rhodococcus oxybenzonivorans]|uniref:ADP ribosyltransferase domain-containing protein n=1 Tax=Rhodococcus oxybenzonivorans TaxID=1990687 RepID=A0A2S2C7N2_9NOCA|nr:hypothetical protein [Rhodococcus oxybenzonivorans]AWK76879.1 hypothetical protein CBI38_36480 [Rhodococcus oxybenzonivorans]